MGKPRVTTTERIQMSDHERAQQGDNGKVTVDEPTQPVLDPVDGPSSEGRDGGGDTSQGTPGGEENPEDDA